MTFMLVRKQTSMGVVGVFWQQMIVEIKCLKWLFLFYVVLTLDFGALNFCLHTGAKMFYNAQDMILRRELEDQADLQQAIELQRRRFMNLQLPDFKNDCIHHHHCSLSVGASVPSSDSIKQEVSEGLLISLRSISDYYLFVGFGNPTVVIVSVNCVDKFLSS